MHSGQCSNAAGGAMFRDDEVLSRANHLTGTIHAIGRFPSITARMSCAHPTSRPVTEIIMSTTTSPRFGRAPKEAVSDNLTDRVRKGAETMEKDASELASSVMHGASDLADTVSTKLRTVGVDTDVMATAARDQASELQRMLGDELKAHPMRALGIAAAVGVFVGLMTAR